MARSFSYFLYSGMWVSEYKNKQTWSEICLKKKLPEPDITQNLLGFIKPNNTLKKDIKYFNNFLKIIFTKNNNFNNIKRWLSKRKKKYKRTRRLAKTIYRRYKRRQWYYGRRRRLLRSKRAKKRIKLRQRKYRYFWKFHNQCILMLKTGLNIILCVCIFLGRYIIPRAEYEPLNYYTM